MNIHKALVHEFMDLMEIFQNTQNKFNEKSRDIVKTQVLLINPQATEEDIERAIEEGPHMIFKSDRAKAAAESLRYVQTKSKEIQKIEQSMNEVHQLFVEVAFLVDQQSEVIDRIAFQIQNVKRDIEEGNQHLKNAKRIQRRPCLVM